MRTTLFIATIFLVRNVQRSRSAPTEAISSDILGQPGTSLHLDNPPPAPIPVPVITILPSSENHRSNEESPLSPSSNAEELSHVPADPILLFHLAEPKSIVSISGSEKNQTAPTQHSQNHSGEPENNQQKSAPATECSGENCDHRSSHHSDEPQAETKQHQEERRDDTHEKLAEPQHSPGAESIQTANAPVRDIVNPVQKPVTAEELRREILLRLPNSPSITNPIGRTSTNLNMNTPMTNANKDAGAHSHPLHQSPLGPNGHQSAAFNEPQIPPLQPSDTDRALNRPSEAVISNPSLELPPGPPILIAAPVSVALAPSLVLPKELTLPVPPAILHPNHTNSRPDSSPPILVLPAQIDLSAPNLDQPMSPIHVPSEPTTNQTLRRPIANEFIQTPATPSYYLLRSAMPRLAKFWLYHTVEELQKSNENDANTRNDNSRKANESGKLEKGDEKEMLLVDPSVQLPSQEDILSDRYESPEFACDIHDSRNAAIYCQGDLLHAVMMMHLFNDSKTFVDKPLKMDPDQIVARFKERFSQSITKDHRDQVIDFVEEHFDVEGNEMEKCDLVDWQEQPQKLMSIDDPALRDFALDVHTVWKKLCRTIKKEVNEQPERFSLLYVPNEFIIPGGRFREFYYWDSYWIVKGLIASGMHETTKRMIENFQHLIERNGFIPNGGRIYYMRRSQPPMFIPMVYEYHMATRDDIFLRKAIDAMERNLGLNSDLEYFFQELEFWKTRRTVQITKNDRNYTVFRYRADSNVPRRVSPDKKRQLWRDIASAAESGWDFSSRWMADRKTMKTTQTSQIAPVDLNAFMCWNMAILAHLHGRIEGVWFDVRVQDGQWEHDAYPSVAAPLFTECYHRLDARMMTDVLDTLERVGYLGFPGGIPTSLVKDTHQQWDYPNGWAPVNHMIVEGLR
ncbi:unnamed protein product, partial [Anisakis simplex]